MLDTMTNTVLPKENLKNYVKCYRNTNKHNQNKHNPNEHFVYFCLFNVATGCPYGRRPKKTVSYYMGIVQGYTTKLLE